MARPTDHQRHAAWLRTHHQMMTTDEARRLGITRAAQAHLIASNRLERLRRTVLVAPGTPRTPELDARAALAQAGPDAVASFLTAAGLWGLIPHLPSVTHITVSRQRRVRIRGVVAHQTRVPPEIARRREMPVTSPSRTLLDLATVPSIRSATLVRLVDEALGRELTAVPRLVAMIREWPRQRCPGGPRLLDILDEAGRLAAPDASALERRLLLIVVPLCEQHDLPQPVIEHRVLDGRYRLDLAWPALRVTAEADGYLWHSSPAAMASDLARRNALTTEGWRHLAFTWHQVVHQPDQVAATLLVALLGASSL